MLRQLRKIFASPIFLNDPVKTHQTALLNTTLLIVAAGILCMIAGALVGGNTRPISYLFLVVCLVTALGFQIPMRRGWVQPTGIFMTVVFTLGITAYIAFNGTVRMAAGPMFLVLVSLMAGLLVSRRAAWISAGVNILIFFCLVEAERSGILPEPELSVTLTQGIAFAVGLVVTVYLLNLATRNMDESLRLAQAELAERKRIEAALRESEERYRTMVETFPDIVMLSNLRGEVLFANQALRSQTGYSLADFQLLGAQNTQFIHPQDLGFVKQAVKNLLDSDEICTDVIENRFIDKQGRIHWYSGIVSKVQYRGELALQTVTRDITARKEAEELTIQTNVELQHRIAELNTLNAVSQIGASSKDEDEMLEATVETLYRSLSTDIIGVGLWDEQTQILYTSPRLHRGMPQKISAMTARLNEGVVGLVAASHHPYRVQDTRDSRYQPLDPEIQSEMCVPILAGEKLIGVLDFESKSPDAFSEADMHFMLTIAGQIASAIERLRAEQKLRRLNSELEQRVLDRTSQLEAANQELEAFSYSVSHDLRAPLRTIASFSQILQQDFTDGMNGMGRGFLEKIIAASKTMNLLIDSLLDFSRLSRKPLDKQLVDIQPVVEQAIEMLAIETSGRAIEWVLQPLPPATADPALIQQVFTNLIGNAVKYSSKCTLARIEIGSLVAQSETVYYVRDNGVGFDMKYADKLFGVFQRLHREEEFKGTGIGLANVRRIIQRHGGRIWAEAEPGQGATFFFTL